MGIRMALGAERRSILGLVLAQGARQLGLGTTLGLLLGAAVSRPMRYVLYGVETADPAVYVLIALTLGAAGLTACALPARAATRSDPSTAMRVT